VSLGSSERGRGVEWPGVLQRGCGVNWRDLFLCALWLSGPRPLAHSLYPTACDGSAVLGDSFRLLRFLPFRCRKAAAAASAVSRAVFTSVPAPASRT